MPNPASRVTLKHVAEEAGVHLSTVWRALKNDTYVEAGKRQQIRDIAERMGYTPDPMLSALSSYRRKQHPPSYRSTLAWVNNYPKRRDCAEAPHIAAYIAGASTFATSMGFRLEEFWLREPGMSPKRAREVLLARNIRCLLFAPQPSANTQISLDLDSFACVSLGYSLTVPRLHVVTNHHHSSTLTSLRELCALGHERIGMVSTSETLRRAEHHFEAPYYFYQAARGQRSSLPLFIMEGRDEPEAVAPWKDRFLAWFRAHQPTAIVTSAGEVSTWLTEAGVNVPGDVSVSTLSRIRDPHCAGIDQQENIIGARAVELLISLFQSGERGTPATPLRLLVEGKWMPGPTVRAVADPQTELLSRLS